MIVTPISAVRNSIVPAVNTTFLQNRLTGPILSSGVRILAISRSASSGPTLQCLDCVQAGIVSYVAITIEIRRRQSVPFEPQLDCTTR